MSSILFDPINLAILIVSFLTIVLGLLVLVEQPREPKNEHFFYFTIAAILWGMSMFLYRNAHTVEGSVLYAKVLYFSAATIPLSFIFFIKNFDKAYKVPFYFKILLTVLTVAFGYVSFSPYFILGVSIPSHGEKIIHFDFLFHIAYAAYIVGYFLIGYVQLFRGIVREKQNLRKQFISITAGTLISSMVGVTTNLLFPLIGIFTFNWAGQVAVIIMTGVIFNSIVRLQLFNIKIITTEIITFSLWVFILIRTLISSSVNDIVANALLLAVSIVTGVLLIRSVKREVDQRERIESLAGELQQANEKLKGLDKLKTEFLSLASHQLRSPLTAIKGYASMLDEGVFGTLDDKQDEAVKRIYASAQGLVNVVEDLLNVSKIEQGGMKYEFSPVNLQKLVTELIGEMQIPAQNKHLEFKTNIPSYDAFMVLADPVKIKQVFLNLVDNSIKYTEKGFVAVSLSRDEHNAVVFKVEDSGVGISPETKAKLFQKFSRGEGGKLNTGGSGLGLYLAREIARAHKGDVIIDSPGLGKGSSFVVTLPPAGATGAEFGMPS